MNIKIVGQEPPPILRVKTGWHSFDRAFINRNGEIGFPIRGIIELYGATSIGKTTFALAIAGRLGSIQKREIGFADIEQIDPENLQFILEMSHFNGNIHVIQGKTDEETLDELIDNIVKNDLVMSVFDSVGAVSPNAEAKGDIGEANMGRRALMLNQFSRKLTHKLQNNPDVGVIMINHQHPRMGGRGMLTPGGETMKYLSTVKIHIAQTPDSFSSGVCLIGTVKKNRFGYKDRQFNIFILYGYGVHDGLTALMDCRMHKIATKDRGGSVKIGDQSFGYMKNILKKAEAGDDEFFQPFHEALKGVSDDRIEELGTEDEYDTDTDDSGSDE